MDKANFEPLDYREKNIDEMIETSQSFLADMKRRRTVREFSDRSIPEEVILNAIRAAGTAPSGANKQPWHFSVVTDPHKKKEIRASAEHEERRFYHERASEEWLKDLEPLYTDENKPFLEMAPCLIVIFLKTSHNGRRWRAKQELLHQRIGRDRHWDFDNVIAFIGAGNIDAHTQSNEILEQNTWQIEN